MANYKYDFVSFGCTKIYFINRIALFFLKNVTKESVFHYFYTFDFYSENRGQGRQMEQLEKIKQPVKEELKKYNAYFKETLQEQYFLVQSVNNYIIRQKGKQMRPILVFLAAQLFGKTNESTVKAATSLEMLHNATLVHDDVIDEANERRGIRSINAIWNNKNAVLMGDYLLSTALTVAVSTHNIDFLEIVSGVGKTLSLGEILQMSKTKTLDMTEEEYFDIISKKTAILFSSCAKAGAITTGADAKGIALMDRYATAMGLAFQLKDDIFDYQSKGLIGKPIGNDLKEKKLTLPIIYAMSKVSAQEKKKIIATIKKHHKNRSKMKELVNFAVAMGGIDYANQKIEEFVQEAKSALNDFPDSTAKQALELYVDFTVNRKK